MASFGTGSNLLGNAAELSAALNPASKTPQLSQISANVPFSGGNVMPVPPSQLPAPSVPTGQMTSQQPKASQSEEEMIVKALIGRLKMLGDITTARPTQM